MDHNESRQTVQRICLEILEEIIVFCEKHQIEYFMMYGSLIGAVRHGGMIPWDDDIDIAMTRKNYLRFIECVRNDGSELLRRNEMKINGSGSTKYVSEAKIGRRGTKYCSKIGEDLDINSQITVDIFCVDYLKASYIKHINQYNLLRRFLSFSKLNWQEKLFLIRVFKQHKNPLKYLFIIGLYLIHPLRLIFTEKGIERLIYKMAVDSTGESKYMGIVCGVRRPLYFSSAFSLKKVKYDNINVLIPSNYDEILTFIYGDYMTLPPENERYGRDKTDFVLEVNDTKG